MVFSILRIQSWKQRCQLGNSCFVCILPASTASSGISNRFQRS